MSDFLEFWVTMTKMILKHKVNDLHFQHMSVSLVQILWFQLKSVTNYRVDTVKFTNRRTKGRTDRRACAGNNNTPSAWKAKGL